MHGFEHEFVRGDHGPKSDRHPVAMTLGNIDDGLVTDGPMDGVDKIARNKLEEIALSVPAPGPSLRSAQVPQVSRL